MDYLRRFFRDAPATLVFAVACVAVYCIEVYQSGSLNDPVGSYSNGSTLGWDLMMVAPFITENDEWWRLATSALVHLNLAHIVFNMVLVLFLGRELERAYGTLTMAASILICAVGGSLAAMWFVPDVAVGGASTVGYGMFAMIVGLAITRKTDIRAPLTLIAVNLLFTVTASGVSLAGHLGGLAAGTMVALVLWMRYGRGATSTPWSSASQR